MRPVFAKYLILFTVPLLAAQCGWAQSSQARPQSVPTQDSPAQATSATQARPLTGVADTALLPPDIPRPVYGPYDTIIVPATVYDNELLPAKTLDYCWVSAPMTAASRRRLEAWTRLKNAVYVTYPYARKAGAIINEINTRMALLNTEKERKAYLQSREKELRKEFTDPLEQMSIFQGKVLMKLINRQTGNSCYEIIKEYKGGLSARFYQTVAFFFSTSLKQPYDPAGEDQAIESIVQEIERMYRG
ncbi:MAG TPA: DUF4294 domain-containing protein [Puia sp.]|nr:DUF4294 domain-containing protein [Puia sp.]